MAPSATNGDALAILDEIKAPDGVVLPPKEIKGQSLQGPHLISRTLLTDDTAILEKTAGYVARNGTVFEGGFLVQMTPVLICTDLLHRSHPRKGKT